MRFLGPLRAGRRESERDRWRLSSRCSTLVASLLGLCPDLAAVATQGRDARTPHDSTVRDRIPAEDQPKLPYSSAKVVKAYPHDPQAFTQGLEYYGGYLYESTGNAGESTLRKVALETGEVIQKVSFPSPYFGEGLTIFHGKIYQLTWLSKKGFVYDLRGFRKSENFLTKPKAGGSRTTTIR